MRVEGLRLRFMFRNLAGGGGGDGEGVRVRTGDVRGAAQDSGV